MTNFIFPRSHLAGLTLSTAGSSATFSVAAGQCADSTNAVIANLAGALSKTTAAWTAGTGNGALDTGSIAASTWYHVHLICDALGQTVDVLISLSATAPTLPAGYTLFRRIGSMKTDVSSNWVLFHQNGDEFLLDTITNDVNSADPGSTGTLFTLASIPTGIQVNALIAVQFFKVSGGTYLQITSPDAANVATVVGTASFFSADSSHGGTGQLSVRTNTSAQIRCRSDAAGNSMYLNTIGWIDRRGKDA